MSFLSPIKTPTRWSELQESQADGIDDLLRLSLVPEAAYAIFKENVSSVEEFTATDEDAATLIVDALATAHPDLFRNPVKQRLCVNNLVLLAQFKQAGGSATASPSIAEIKAFVEASKMPPSVSQRFSPSPTPDQSPPDSKQVNGMKLAVAIPEYKGEEEKWFDWRDIVLMKIGQFPAFGKVFQDEAEALKDTVTSEVLYNIFKEKTFGGAAHTLVESVTPKTGFHAFQALSEAMEGTEVAERLQAQADLLEASAKKDSSKSFLEFQGDMLKYLDVLDKVEALEKRPKVSEEKKIRTILKAITDGAYKETVLRLHGEIRKKNINTSQELFSELRKVETNVLTGDFDDAKKPPATLRRSTGHPGSGPNTESARPSKKGSPATFDISDVQLSSGLYESLDPKQQVWFLDWKRKWKETGELSEAIKVPAPSEEAVERHKKRRASAARLDKGSRTGSNPQTKKQKQKHRKSNTKGAEGQTYPPSSSSTRPGALSIQTLASGDSVVPDCTKNLPTLRVVMFKEPKGVSIPFSSSSKTHRPMGMLAINANRTKNPKEEDIDLNSRDYSYVDPPRTKLSTVSSRQVSISRLVKSRKLVVESAVSASSGVTPHVLDIAAFARDNAHEWESQVSRPASTPTLSLRVRRAHSPVRARPTRSILDTGCDWSVVALGWKVLREYDELFCCQGAFAEGDEVHCRLVDAITVFTFPPSSAQPPILVRANRVLYLDDPAQFESLLDPVQLWANGIMLDLCATQFPAMNGGQGKQGMQVSGSFYPFDFDGQQLYFHHRLPSQHELDNLPHVILTSGDSSVYPLPASRKPTVFRRSGHTVLVTRRRRLPKEELTKWRGRLCYVPDAVILKTLAATTQLIESVEVENRLVPRKHLVSRLLPLRHRRLRESFATDWFHVTTRSTRSYRGFQLYVGQKSKTLFPYCLRRKLHMVDSLLELCRDVGIPERLMMDGDGAQNNPEVTRVVNDYIIKVHNSEPENQQQNWAERGGATVKQGIRRLHFETKFEIAYWCYAVQHFCDCFNHTACRELGWQCRLEALHGPTQDISVFRFVFWDHVWFWDPHIRFPASQWRLGRFLGRAKNVGDPFTFWVKPVRQNTDVREPRVLSRSVVRECVDVNEGPLDKNDCVDLPVADLLFPSVPSPLEPLETIMEEPDEDEDVNETGLNELDAFCLVDSAESKAVADMILPETVELEDCVDGLADDPITPEDVFFDSEELFPMAGGDNDGQLPVVSQDDFADDALQFDDPVDTSEAADVVNNAFGYLCDADGSPCDFVEILSHRGDSVSSLELEIRWTNGTNTWASFADVKEDQPALAAKYILANTIRCDTSGSLARWARAALRTLKRSIRRIRRAYRFATTPDTSLSLESWRSLPFRARIRKSTNSPAASPSSKQSTKSKKKKPGRNNRHLGEVKYGVSIPRSVREALQFDEENGDTLWTDAMSKEICALQQLNCFRVQERQNWNPREEGYQFAPLRIVFDVKPDGRRKARLVVGGHVVHCDMNTYASTVKSLSVRLLHLIAHANNLTPLCGDIGNAFVNSYTKEKVYCRAGPEFGPLEGKTLIIVKSLYGLKSSAERWRAHFAETLRSMGFESSRADQDVWLRCRDDGSGYDYICTHVDDFTIFAKDPWSYMKTLQSLYVVRDIGPPKYYLGNDFFSDAEGNKYMGSSTYVTEAINKVESKVGELTKERSPSPPGDHPELDSTPPLGPEPHRLFQMLIGMAVWIVMLGRMDIAQAVSSLSRFSAAPREGHLERAYRIFSYLKRRKHMAIRLDSRPPLIDHGSLHSGGEPDFQTIYPYAAEDIDPKLPMALGAELAVTVIVDADHAHDLATRRSISGLIVFVGRTPVVAISKRQSSVQSSTYGAEFLAARAATEEILSIRYFLRSFGVKVTRASRLFGDNMSVLLNITEPDSQLKKKHLCIAYHILRENIASHVLEAFYIPSAQNYSDFLTKGLVAPLHDYHTNGLLYHVPPEQQLPFA